MSSAHLLEQNLDRVVDSVLRSLVPGREAETETDATPGVGADEAASRQIMADLCGHVAFALRSLEESPHVVGSFRPPVPPGAEGSQLDVRR